MQPIFQAASGIVEILMAQRISQVGNWQTWNFGFSLHLIFVERNGMFLAKFFQACFYISLQGVLQCPVEKYFLLCFNFIIIIFLFFNICVIVIWYYLFNKTQIVLFKKKN